MDIRTWLTTLDLEQYADTFEENDITLEDLEELSSEELKDDLGISSLGHRKKLLKAIEALGGINEEEQKIIDSYPYLIAYPFKTMLEEKNSFQKLQLMKDVFLNFLKYLGLLTATEYFLSAIKSSEINSLFKEKLYQPHFGHWNHFIRESLAILEQREHAFVIPELPDYYRSVQLNKKAPTYTLETRYTDETGEVQTIKKNLTAIDGLINFRNRYIGHGVTLSGEQSAEIYETYYPLLADLLKAMDFCANYPIFRYHAGKVFRLMGMAASPEGEQSPPEKATENIWLGTPAGNRLPLVPFFIPPEQYMANLSANIQLFIYEQHTSRRILYFSPEQTSGETAGEPVSLLEKLLEEKSRLPALAADELELETLAEVCRAWSGRTMGELEQERKVLPGVYQRRRDNEAELQNFLDSSAALYFLAAEAGSGKTNLLAETFRKAVKDDRICLLLRAGRLEENTLADTLRKILNLREGDNPGTMKALEQPGDPLLILIDGGNEHPSPTKFFHSVKPFLESCPPGSVKIVLTWRVNSAGDYPEAFPGMETWLFSSGGGSAATEGTVLQTGTGKLKPLDRQELAEAWTKYTKSSSKAYKPVFSLEDLEMKDRSFVKNLSNPLLLRMFMELYNGKGLGKKVKVLRIWPAWYDRLKEKVPGADEFLMTIADQMYTREETELDLDGLYDHPLLAEVMRQLHIDSPYRRLLTLGVLSQYFRDGYLVISFTLEAAYHYILSRYLAERVGASSGAELKDILDAKGSLSGVSEAVSILLLDDVVEGQGALMEDFLATPGISAQTAALPLARALELGDPAEVMHRLAARNFPAAAGALLEADYNLERNLQTEIRYGGFTVLADLIETGKAPEDEDLRFRVLWRYNIICHEHGKYEQALEYARAMEELRVKSRNTDELMKSRVYNRLCIAYRKLMRSVDEETAVEYGDKALEYGSEALEIMERLLPAGHPELWKIYDTMEKVHEYRGEWKDAITFGKKLIDAMEASLDRFHPSLAPAYNNTAIVLREDGLEEESIAFSNRAMEIVSRSLDPNHIEMAYANWTLANTCDKFGKPAEAVKAISKTLSILKKLLPEDHPNLSMAREVLEKFSAKAKG